ncbi:MAG: 1-deoxy-D-xylulose-5-phosphate reductoisomerase, partial [Bacteroidia bacterium]|nr:1-deoxy-D-xylulose-5-phosphate reductoisomerase [Bacteroidia bacterium]
PQSIIHSMVQFEDGSIKAQMGLPDMKLPIQYALAYPKRLTTQWPRFNFTQYPQLSFEAPDTSVFTNLQLAYDALHRGGNMPCVLNAANEVAVKAFLMREISFNAMSDLIAHCMAKAAYVKQPTYSDYVQTDRETRRQALTLIGSSNTLLNEML